MKSKTLLTAVSRPYPATLPAEFRNSKRLIKYTYCSMEILLQKRLKMLASRSKMEEFCGNLY